MVVEWVAKACCRFPAVKLQSSTVCKVLCRLAPRDLKTAESKWLKRYSGLLVAPSLVPLGFSRAVFSARLQRCPSQSAQEQQAGSLMTHASSRITLLIATVCLERWHTPVPDGAAIASRQAELSVAELFRKMGS